MGQRYYVSRGLKGVMLTLRVHRIDFRGNETDEYVMTLGGSPETAKPAVDKFEEEEGVKVDTSDIDMHLNQRGLSWGEIKYGDIDPANIPGPFKGKYRGQTWKEIADADADYLCWYMGNAALPNELEAIKQAMPTFTEDYEAARLTAQKEKAERAAELERKRAASRYVGTIKERMTLEVTLDVAFSFEVEDRYDYIGGMMTKYIYVFRDSNDNAFKWITGVNIHAEQNDKLTIKGTVKEHEEYKGEQQTVLTRVKIQEEK
jgi:hypothetical protein